MFKITATLAGVTVAKTFTADDAIDATFAGIAIVLDNAAANPTGAWAKGAIELTDLATGEVLQTMDAK